MPEPTLHWRLRSSLVDYLQTLPDGKIETFEGADVDSSGRFQFWDGMVSVDAIRWTGRVKLSGHHGMLHVEFREPELLWTEPNPTLRAVCWDPVDETWGLATLATLCPQGVPRPCDGEWTAEARLHDDGAELLGRLHYWEGQPLDVVTVLSWSLTSPGTTTSRRG